MAGRVLVYLRKLGESSPRLAQFSDCLLDGLGKGDAGSASVTCDLADNKLVLEWKDGGCTLTHPPFCPVFCSSRDSLEKLPVEIRDRGVDVGVVSVLETSDSHVLLTRRARHMRTFPSTWVPPGGHIDPGEKLMEAALRELKEETALTFNSVLDSSLLCMWESVYPYSLALGPPHRHHLVIYFRLKVKETHQELQHALKLDPEEVDAAVWIDHKMARVIATGSVPDGCPDLTITTVHQDEAGSRVVHVDQQLPAAVMAAEAPTSGPDIERVSTGTRYAMQHWLERYGPH